MHLRKYLIGDFDHNGGVSDINGAVHGWLNPVARVTNTKISDDDTGNTSAPGAVIELSGLANSSTALEIFWQGATNDTNCISGYESESASLSAVVRAGDPAATDQVYDNTP